MQQIMFNPLRDKKPYGATAVGKKTAVRFSLDEQSGVERLFIVLRKENRVLRYELPLQSTGERNRIFEGAFSLDDGGIWHYRFEGELSDGAIAFFGRNTNGDAIRGDWLPEWQLTVTKSDYKVPNWSKSGIIYHIFADRFNRVGSRTFDKLGRLHDNWYDKPEIPAPGVEYRADDFFGGNIEGIIEKLDYLSLLGVTCLYLSPVFEATSNHRYDTGDYLKIDGLFGDEQQFKSLIRQADSRGMKVILDGVFNHTGSDSLYFNRFGRYPSLGAYQSKQSPYYDWYFFSDYPDKYHCWWGNTCVPTVNKSAKGYRELILGRGGVVDKWQSLGVKGWRLDVVDELPIDFTTDLCRSIREKDSDALIIGEVWEDASTKVSYGSLRPYFMGEQLDGVMNYPFKTAIIDFVNNGSSADFVETVSHILENYPKESLDCSMILIGTHDTVRALTLLGAVAPPEEKLDRAAYSLSDDNYALAVKKLKLASLLQYTLPGVPCLFYGDEVGIQGFEDPMNRATYPWGREDKCLLDHYRRLGELRTAYADYLNGETHFVEGGGLLNFARKSAKGELKVEVFLEQRARISVNSAVVFELT